MGSFYFDTVIKSRWSTGRAAAYLNLGMEQTAVDAIVTFGKTAQSGAGVGVRRGSSCRALIHG